MKVSGNGGRDDRHDRDLIRWQATSAKMIPRRNPAGAVSSSGVRNIAVAIALLRAARVRDHKCIEAARKCAD